MKYLFTYILAAVNAIPSSYAEYSTKNPGDYSTIYQSNNDSFHLKSNSSYPEYNVISNLEQEDKDYPEEGLPGNFDKRIQDKPEKNITDQTEKSFPFLKEGFNPLDRENKIFGDHKKYNIDKFNKNKTRQSEEYVTSKPEKNTLNDHAKKIPTKPSVNDLSLLKYDVTQYPEKIIPTFFSDKKSSLSEDIVGLTGKNKPSFSGTEDSGYIGADISKYPTEENSKFPEVKKTNHSEGNNLTAPGFNPPSLSSSDETSLSGANTPDFPGTDHYTYSGPLKPSYSVIDESKSPELYATKDHIVDASKDPGDEKPSVIGADANSCKNITDSSSNSTTKNPEQDFPGYPDDEEPKSSKEKDGNTKHSEDTPKKQECKKHCISKDVLKLAGIDDKNIQHMSKEKVDINDLCGELINNKVLSKIKMKQSKKHTNDKDN